MIRSNAFQYCELLKKINNLEKQNKFILDKIKLNNSNAIIYD